MKTEDIFKNISDTDVLPKRKTLSIVEKNARCHGTKNEKPYALMSRHWARRYDNNDKTGELLYPGDYVNNELCKEIEDFKKFRYQNHNCSEATVEKDIKTIYRILGWLHRYKGLDLDELRLTSIIYFSKLNVPFEEASNFEGKYNYEKFMLMKTISNQKSLELANANKALIEEFLEKTGKHPGTKAINITTCIALSKFIFRNEVGTDDYLDDNDLPIVKRLNKLCNIFNSKAKSTPPAIAHLDKSIPWEDAIQVLETCRHKADATKKYSIGKDGNNRSQSGIVHDLQLFLSLAFMVLIPVDRPRTYYNLEIGRTFVYGIYQDGRFVPATKIKDGEEATWYIHLMPGDYKTGKVYGEYWGIMPNVKFADGKKLYDYIDRWINYGRDFKGKCDRNRSQDSQRLPQKIGTYKW